MMDWLVKMMGLPEHFLNSFDGLGGGSIQVLWFSERLKIKQSVNWLNEPISKKAQTCMSIYDLTGHNL